MPKEKKARDVLAPRASKVTKPGDKEKKRASKAPAPAFKSADRVVDSDDEDVHEQPLPTVGNGGISVGDTARATIVNGSKSKASKQSNKREAELINVLTLESKKRIERLAKDDDSEDSTSSGEESEDEFVAGIKSRIGHASTDEDAPNSDRDKDNSNESEDEDETEQDSNLEQQGARKSHDSLKHVSRANDRILNEIEDSDSRPTIQYTPPTGFRLIKDEPISAEITELLSPKSTGDKEIWYISAPASLPITALKEVALEKFAKQQPIMVHDGAQYALVSDPAARDATRLLLPSKKKNGYEVLPSPVDHVLQFQQILDVQATAIQGRPKSTAQVLLDTHLPTKPAKKSQPKGLKARFRPIGFGTGDLGDIGSSEDEEVQTPVTFRQPPTLSQGESLPMKRKELTNIPTRDNAEKKKSKRDQNQQAFVDIPEQVARKNENYVVEATTSIAAQQAAAPPESQMPEGKKKKKKDKDKALNENNPSIEDVPMQDVTVPAIEEDAMQIEESQKVKKKRKKDKKGEVAEDYAGVVNGTTGDLVDEIFEKKKKKKKEKKEKRKSGFEQE